MEDTEIKKYIQNRIGECTKKMNHAAIGSDEVLIQGYITLMNASKIKELQDIIRFIDNPV